MKQSGPKAISIGRLKAPASVFTRCLECDSPNIQKRDGHVFCTYCRWNSVPAYEELAVKIFGFDLNRLDLASQFNKLIQA